MNAIDAGGEEQIRLVVFIGLFLLLAVAERLVPMRSRLVDWRIRWLNNLGLSVLNTLLLRLLIPISGTYFAVVVMQQGWSLLNLSSWPVVISIVVFVLVFDLAIYFQHRLFHYFAPLWGLHRVHHTDLDYDVTTGTRFHPLSILISMVIKLLLVLILGPLPVAILVAEMLLNATSMFNHSNLMLPKAVDRILRWFIVTPDMHRIHHSVLAAEHNCNFGFNFPWWDRLFGTYAVEPRHGQHGMTIGIDGYTGNQAIRIDRLLVQPFCAPTVGNQDSETG